MLNMITAFNLIDAIKGTPNEAAQLHAAASSENSTFFARMVIADRMRQLESC